MEWFNHNSDSSKLSKTNASRFLIMSVLYILIIFLIPFILLNCEKELKELVAPNVDEFPASPLNLKATVDDRSIVLSWQMNDTTDIDHYNIYRKDSTDAKMELLDSSFVMSYVDKNVTNGRIYYYQVVAVNEIGFEGNGSNEVSARPSIYNVIIQNGDDYVNTRTVTLNLIAPASTRYMLIAHDSFFTNSTWENYSSTKSWTLAQGDGLKYVYVKFRDSEENENRSLIYDTITLDTQAAISEVSENTNGKIIQPGEYIHFVLISGEPEGKATIDIGTVKPGITLFDDGTHGDAIANNGKYEIDYQTPSDLEVVNATITGHFTDRASNIAIDVTAKKQITIQRSPKSVQLYLQKSSDITDKTLQLIWTQNQDTDFANYRLFRSNNAGVDTSSLLLTMITDQTTTSYTDSDIKEGVNYYYRLFVYDNSGLATGSNEVNGGINSNVAPTPVTLDPIIPTGNSTTSLSLNWSINEDADFSSYRIFRSKTSGVDSTDLLVTSITDQSVTSYDDATLQQNTEYYYRVYVFDIGGLSAGSNEQKGKTSINEPPMPVTLDPITPIENSTTSLNLNWSINEDPDFSSYRVFRSKISGVDSTDLLVTKITDQTTTSYNDTTLQQNTEYYYRVYVYDMGGLSVGSNEQKGKTSINEPPMPVTLAPIIPIDKSTTSLNLNWSINKDPDFASYRVFRSKTAGVDSTDLMVTKIADQSVNSYNDTTLQQNSEYYYRVYVFDTGGLSAGSNEQKGKTNVDEPPMAVILYKPSPIINSTTSLHLGWSTNIDSDFVSYRIYRSKTAGVTNTASSLDTTILDRNMTNHNDIGLLENTTYYYRVYVYDKGGKFSASNEANGTTSANEAPTPVTLSQPIMVDSTTLHLVWTQNNDTDFKMYTVYRSLSSPVITTGSAISFIYDNTENMYTDEGLTPNVTYFYQIVVTDTGAKSTGSNETSGTPHP